MNLDLKFGGLQLLWLNAGRPLLTQPEPEPTTKSLTHVSIATPELYSEDKGGKNALEEERGDVELMT